MPALTLNLKRWHKVWLSRPWQIHPVPGTAMIEIHGVRGFLTPGDVVYLFNLAAQLPAGGCYLEIGSWMGLSSIVFANGLIANVNFQAKLFCIDTGQGSPEHQQLEEVVTGTLYEQFLKNIREAQVEGLIHPIRGHSAEVAANWSGPAPDLIFIDGEHSEEACYRDICHWHRKLGKGGRLLGHDAIPGGEVEQAVRRFCAGFGYHASVCPMPGSHYVWEIHEDVLPLDADHQLLC